MNKSTNSLTLTLSACALATTLFLAACGGGTTTDTVPPTVVITSAAATGADVNFTFTFSEALFAGTFTSADIVVSGGTAGTFTMVDASHATLLVTPTSGPLSVSVAANKFDDLAHNFNTVSATGSYAVPTINFEGIVAFEPFEGLVSAALADDPVLGAVNKVAKFVKGPTGQPWAGATIYTSGSLATPTVSTVDLANNKIITVRSYTGAAIGTKMTLKLEDAAAAGQNIAAETVTTKQNAWETLTFNFASPSTGVFNPATTYNKASIFPAFSIPAVGSVAPSVNTDFYFDDLTYTAIAAAAATAPTVAATVPPARLVSDVVSIYSDAYAPTAGINYFPNWGQTTIDAEVQIAGNNTRKYTSFNYEGITFTPIDVSSMTKLHMDVWTPDLTALDVFILSGAPAAEQSIQVTPTKAGWNSLDIDLAGFTNPNKAAIKEMKLVATGGSTLYFDNLYFYKPAATVVTPTAVTFMSGFKLATTVEGGGYGGYSGSSLDGWNCPGSAGTTTNCGSGGSFTDGTTPAASAAASSFYYYYQFTGSAPTGEYVGVYAQAPGVTALSASADTAGLVVAGKTNINFTLEQNPEWNGVAAGNNFAVLLTLGKYYSVGSGACNFKLLAVVTPTALSATYTIPLSAFTVTQNCGVTLADAAAALAMAPVSQIDFQGDSGGAALTAGGKTTSANTAVASGGGYTPTTIALKGGITFN
jgi:Bacterial Ig-like domain